MAATFGGNLTMMDSDDNSRLIIAVPKKGRLCERALHLIESIDIKFFRKARHDIALSTNLPIKIVFQPAADIPKFVGRGNVDIGITGFDMVVEAGLDDHVDKVLDLGFGFCNLCVQVPEESEVRDPRDLVGKRIVTSFPHSSSNYFRALENGENPDSKSLLQNGNGSKPRTDGFSSPVAVQTSSGTTDIMYVSGSVETACALGLADGIVDLVESGETMKAMGLRKVSTVLSSQAVLIQNKKTSHPQTAHIISQRIEGFLCAQRYLLCTYNLARDKLPVAAKITPGRTAPTITPLDDQNYVSVSAMIEKKHSAGIMDELSATGAKDILVFAINNMRAR